MAKAELVHSLQYFTLPPYTILTSIICKKLKNASVILIKHLISHSQFSFTSLSTFTTMKFFIISKSTEISYYTNTTLYPLNYNTQY